jgi:hypothetical protein
VYVAVALLLLAGLARFVAPRVPGGWGLDGLLPTVSLLGCCGAAVVPTAEAQVIAGLGLTADTRSPSGGIKS